MEQNKAETKLYKEFSRRANVGATDFGWHIRNWFWHKRVTWNTLTPEQGSDPLPLKRQIMAPGFSLLFMLCSPLLDFPPFLPSSHGITGLPTVLLTTAEYNYISKHSALLGKIHRNVWSLSFTTKCYSPSIYEHRTYQQISEEQA